MRTQLIIWIILVPMLAITSHPVRCQSSSKPKKAKVYTATISVSTQESNIIGVLQNVGDSAIYLLVDSGSVKIPAGVIQEIVIRRKGNVGRSVLTGSLIGLGIGGLVGIAISTGDCNGANPCFAGEMPLAFAVIGTGAGAFTGLIIGSIPKKTIFVGQDLMEFERNAELLRKYTMPDAPAH